jgi:uncharacterized protein (TIGR02266 family)
MDASEHRRDERYPIRMPVTLIAGKKSQTLLTEDVSMSGLFVRTDQPPPLRQLVRIQMSLPPGNTALSTFGTIVHVVPPNDAAGRVPGSGVQLYAMDRDARELWAAFIRHVASTIATATPVPAAVTAQVDPIRRRFERHRAELELLVATVEQLHTLYSHDISKGGMFIRTDLALPPGERLLVRVVHPETGESFALEAVVRRASTDPRLRGLGVEFVNMDERARERLFEFIRSELLVLDDDDVIAVPSSRAGAALHAPGA